MYNNELRHYGVLGMKWGVRKYQNKDGSLTPAGLERYGKSIRKQEAKAIQRHYRESRKNGGPMVFKSFRTSTGKNFDDAQKRYAKSLKQDPKRLELQRKAYEAEKRRLLAEKDYVDDDAKYNKYLSSEKAKKLYAESTKAAKELEAYISKKGKEYVDVIKEAKLKDLNISDNKELAKRFVSGKFDDFFFTKSLTYNPDNYYESWVDNEPFRG